MYSLSRRAVNGVVSPIPNHKISLKPLSHSINLGKSKTLPMQKLKISSSLNPNFSLNPSIVKNSSSLIPIVKTNFSSLITSLGKKDSSIPFELKFIIAYVLFRLSFKRILKRIRKIIVVGGVRSNFRVGDYITTTVDGEEVRGNVEIKGLFGTTVKLEDGKRFYISNEDLLNSGSVRVQSRAPFIWKYCKDAQFESSHSLNIREEDMKLKMGNIFQKVYFTVKIELDGVILKFLELAGAHKTLTISDSIDLTDSSVDKDTTDTSTEEDSGSADPVDREITITTTSCDSFTWIP